jgi:hypothetical protein
MASVATTDRIRRRGSEALKGVASLAALVLGGPRTGYLPGIVISTIIVMAITWRYDPSQFARWSVVSENVYPHKRVGQDVASHHQCGTEVVPL